MVTNEAYDHVRSRADSGVPSSRLYCSASAPDEGVYRSARATKASAYASAASRSVLNSEPLNVPSPAEGETDCQNARSRSEMVRVEAVFHCWVAA